MKRLSAVLVLAAALLVAPLLPAPARASAAGRKNTAWAATGVALYELATGHTTPGLLAAAGAGYAWHQYNVKHKRVTGRRAYYAGYAQGVRHEYRYTHTRHRVIRRRR